MPPPAANVLPCASGRVVMVKICQRRRGGFRNNSEGHGRPMTHIPVMKYDKRRLLLVWAAGWPPLLPLGLWNNLYRSIRGRPAEALEGGKKGSNLVWQIRDKEASQQVEVKITRICFDALTKEKSETSSSRVNLWRIQKCWMLKLRSPVATVKYQHDKKKHWIRDATENQRSIHSSVPVEYCTNETSVSVILL